MTVTRTLLLVCTVGVVVACASRFPLVRHVKGQDGAKSRWEASRAT